MILNILTHTPKWVFGLFVFLLYLGWQQSRPRSINKYAVFVLPVGMMFLSFFGLISSFGASFLTVALWVFGFVVAAFSVYVVFPVHGVTYDKSKSSFYISGSWIPLMLMMAIFFTKYIVGALSALNPTLLELGLVIYSFGFIYGFFSGMFAGRAFSVWFSGRAQSPL